MSWELVLNHLLVVGLLSSIVFTFGFYLHFRKEKKISKVKKELSPIEGRYFQRYIPTQLHEKYGINLNKDT